MRRSCVGIQGVKFTTGVSAVYEARRMVYSSYTKRRILFYSSQDYKPPAIQNMLFDEEGIVTTRQGIARFLKVYCETGSIDQRPGSGRKTKASTEVRQIVEEQMRKDDETTAVQLHHLLETKGYKLSFSTILRCRKALGWTYRGSAYCQLIRDANKEKRASWARQHFGDDFENVIWTDETTVQLESHRRFACRKRGEPPRPKPRYPWTASVQYIHVLPTVYTCTIHVLLFRDA